MADADLSPQQQAEIRKMVSKGAKTAADAARLFKIHPATGSAVAIQGRIRQIASKLLRQIIQKVTNECRA